MASNNLYPLTTILPVDPIPVDRLPSIETLEIIAQPCYTSKLRYRSEYQTNKNRRGNLHSQNNPNYQSPAIRIPQQYLDVTEQYYIRICLVTVVNETTNCRYIHPYDLEDISIEEHNDRINKGVWFPIQPEDIGGIKSFPNLRIVRKKETDLKNYGDLRVFDSPIQETTPQLSAAKVTIREFNLSKSQLAFTVSKKLIQDNAVTMISYAHTTIFSDELIDSVRELDPDNSPTESTAVRSRSSRSSICRMHKYAPRKGSVNGNDEVLIFFTNKIKLGKYGDLQVTFECDRSDGVHWAASVSDLEVKDQMVSFRTPNFPFDDHMPTTVNIVLKQKKRFFELLEFDYIPMGHCPTCQGNTIRHLNPIVQDNPNKRRHSRVSTADDESDSIPFYEGNPTIQESTSEVEASSIFTTMTSAPLPPTNEDSSQLILDKLAESIASLFSNKDFKPILRVFRPFIRKRPELLHNAIDHNHSELIPTFISIASIDLLQEKNQFGETALLHAARLNRVDIIKVLLKKQNSDKLLEDTNNKGQNIFHILASNIDSDEILKLLIDHLLNKSINIQEKFDNLDNENHTPLQLAISNNNLSATDHLLKYFDNHIYTTNNQPNDDSIQRTTLDDDLIKND